MLFLTASTFLFVFSASRSALRSGRRCDPCPCPISLSTSAGEELFTVRCVHGLQGFSLLPPALWKSCSWNYAASNGTLSSHRKSLYQSSRKSGCTNNMPHFPQGWRLMAPLHNLPHLFLSAQISCFIPSALPWTESRCSCGFEPWTSRKISNRNLEICSSTWLWKLWALPDLSLDVGQFSTWLYEKHLWNHSHIACLEEYSDL